MKNRLNYAETRRILESNVIRLSVERNLTPRALSLKIEKNAWYITRMLNGELNPSLEAICKIAKVLRVSVADLFTEK